MSEVQKVNARMSVPNKPRTHLTIVPLSMDEVIDFIKSRGYDTYTTAELLKKAATYPQSALRNFCSNIERHIASITKIKREEMLADRWPEPPEE